MAQFLTVMINAFVVVDDVVVVVVVVLVVSPFIIGVDSVILFYFFICFFPFLFFSPLFAPSERGFMGSKIHFCVSSLYRRSSAFRRKSFRCFAMC